MMALSRYAVIAYTVSAQPEVRTATHIAYFMGDLDDSYDSN